MADSCDVFGVGNALVDILALVDDDFIASRDGIEKGGMMLVDAVKQADLLNDLEGSELRLRSGGSAANTMIAVAQSGGSSFYAGKVAADPHGEFYKQDLEEAGVQFSSAPSHEGPTGTSLILTTPDTERTMCTHLGVSTDLDEQDVNIERLSSSKIAYIEGYLWDAEKPRAASKHAMATAKSRGVQVALTFSDMFLVDRFGDDFRQIVNDYCDIVFCNADEVRHFFRVESLDECAKQLGKIVETAFVTDGKEGCHVVHRGLASHVEGFEAKAVDTVGAGDAFAGGVLFGLTSGLDYEDAARWGNYVASRVVQVYGARLEESIAGQVDKVLGR